MGLLDGDLAQIIGDALVGADLALPGTLTRITPTPRDPLHPTAATSPITTTVNFSGFVASLTPYQLRGTLIKDVTRIIKIYGSTLGGVVPAPGDKVLIDNATTTIVDNSGRQQAISADPARAVYTCQTK